jgi:hypothetical protein
MKKMWMVVAILAAGSSISVGRVAAQGPAGAGASAAADSSSHPSHSYNPIKWVKKDTKSSNSTDANTDKNKKLTLSLQQQGVLTAETNVTEKCATFKELGSCVAALHASHSLGLDFDCLKANVTGVLTSADTTSCQRAGGDKGASLEKSIHMIKPDADAKGAAKEAEKRAKEDLKQASA